MINFKNLEKVIKGAANHWRLKILFLLKDKPGLPLMDIAEELSGHFKTISQHTKKLLDSGLIVKRYQNRSVLHSLSQFGHKFLGQIEKLV